MSFAVGGESETHGRSKIWTHTKRQGVNGKIVEWSSAPTLITMPASPKCGNSERAKRHRLLMGSKAQEVPRTEGETKARACVTFQPLASITKTNIQVR